MRRVEAAHLGMKTTSHKTWAAGMGLLLFACASAAGAWTGVVAYVASGGGTATNAAFRSFGSVGVGGGFEQLSSSFIGRNGALFSFLMDPARDNDGDGIADEDDPDDDNDALKDVREILGDMFSPTTATDSMRRRGHRGQPLT